MKLPVLEYPIYDIDLSIGKIKFRPFLVKEQKILMMSVENKDIKETIKTVKEIIKSCCLDKIDVDNLPLIDLETFFINLRARSMGEVMDIYFKCNNQIEVAVSNTFVMGENRPTTEMKSCGMILESSVNLLNLKPSVSHESNKIQLSDSVGVEMHYPTFELVNHLISSNTNAEFVVVAGCIETIWDASSVYKAKDASPEELEEFVEALPQEKYELLKNFVVNSPKIRYEAKQTCPKCKYEHTLVLEGLSDFFT